MSNVISLFQQNGHWPLVQQIVLILNQAEEQAFLAGGCVRDALLGRMPKDFDVATSARPEKILSLFPKSRQQGKAFGVVVVFDSQGREVEVATFRKDGPYRDGRHPEYVTFLSDKEDALRRDFTINALFYDTNTHKIIDYVGGLPDLQKKIIRCVGDPSTRFQEDHLRILRALRFSLQLNFPIEKQTEQTLFKMKAKLLNISKERVYEESFKILQTKKWAKILSVFNKVGLLKEFTGLLEVNYDWAFCQRFWNQYPALNLIQDNMFELKKPSLSKSSASKLLQNKVSLWAWAFFPLVIPILLNQKGLDFKTSNTHSLKTLRVLQKNLKKWKFPLSVIKELKGIFDDSVFILKGEKASLGKKLKLWDKPLACHLFLLCKAYLQSQAVIKKPVAHTKDKSAYVKNPVSVVEREWNPTQILKDMEKTKQVFKTISVKGRLPKPLVNGYDLKALGFKEGPAMAHKLEKLYDIQLEQNIKDKKTLLKKDT